MGDFELGIGSKVKHPKFGLGVICNLDSQFYKIYFTATDALKQIDRSFGGLEVVDKVTLDTPPLALTDIESALEQVFLKYTEKTRPVQLANKWLGGTITLKPGDNELQGKEIPIQSFFSKIVSVREKLRVLEQNVNNHDKLDEADKLQLQQYISRAYGSLTTFNVLFAQKEDYFTGTGKSK